MEKLTSEDIEQLKNYIVELSKINDIARNALAGNGGTLADFVAEYSRLNSEYNDLLLKVLHNYEEAGLLPQPEDAPPKTIIELAEELIADPELFEKLQFPLLASVPNGDSVNFLFRAGANNFNLYENDNNRHEKIEITDFKGTTTIIKRNTQKHTEIKLEIEGADLFQVKNNKTFSKLLSYTLQELNRQNFPRKLSIRLQDLVDLGMYATISNAGRAYKDFFQQQRKILISGSFKKGKTPISQKATLLFYTFEWVGNYVYMGFSEEAETEFFAPYFTVFPRFAYGLSNNGFLLVRYIFFLARQKTAEIKKNGSFNVKLDSVREYLGLPHIEEVKLKNRKYKQYIITPIEEAVEEVEEALKNQPEERRRTEPSFTFLFHGTDTKKINEWLEGYLEIGLKADFAETFIAIAEKTEKDIAERKKAKLKAEAQIAAKNDKKP